MSLHMTSSNCYSSLYPFPFDLNKDDQHHHEHHHLVTLKSQLSSSSSCCQREPQQFHDQQHQAKTYDPQDGVPSGESRLKLSISKKEEGVDQSDDHGHHEDNSDRWMPSKLRILRKIMSSSDHTDLSKTKTKDPKVQNQPSSSPDNSINSNNSPIRVCADCNTTKTPLWRTGPKGPKSLCNACGIRQRKARRAMAAAAAASNGTIIAAETKTNMKSKVQNKAKRSSSTNGCVAKLKNKKSKLNSQSQGRKKLCFEDLRLILSQNSSFHRVFPQDEKEAAILLMALSYGLVHGCIN